MRALYALLVLGCFVLHGCAVEAVDDYAREHNLLGERVCNADQKDVGLVDVLERGCPIGELTDSLNGGIQSEKEEEVNPRAEAL